MDGTDIDPYFPPPPHSHPYPRRQQKSRARGQTKLVKKHMVDDFPSLLLKMPKSNPVVRYCLMSKGFFPQLNVVGLLNSAHECLRPSLLDFLFSDPPLPAAIIVMLIIVIVNYGYLYFLFIIICYFVISMYYYCLCSICLCVSV